MKILVIDDDRAALEFAQRSLEEAGYQVTTLSSPEGVAVAVARELPDLVLLDVAMPGLSGVDIVRFLRAGRDTRDIPVVLYSVLDRNELDELTQRIGATAWIQKTESAQVLRDCIYRIRTQKLGR